MSDLADGVDSRIGSAAANHPCRVVCDTGYGLFDTSLDRGFLPLNLPAKEFTAIVFEPYGESHQKAKGCTFTE